MCATSRCLSRPPRPQRRRCLPRRRQDNGELAAWFLLSALGLYGLVPGSGAYTLGTPLYASASLALPNNATLHVRAAGNGPGRAAVAAVAWNGAPVDGTTLPLKELAKGGLLEFTLA